jgi:hypothetical protein
LRKLLTAERSGSSAAPETSSLTGFECANLRCPHCRQYVHLALDISLSRSSWPACYAPQPDLYVGRETAMDSAQRFRKCVGSTFNRSREGVPGLESKRFFGSSRFCKARISFRTPAYEDCGHSCCCVRRFRPNRQDDSVFDPQSVRNN